MRAAEGALGDRPARHEAVVAVQVVCVAVEGQRGCGWQSRRRRRCRRRCPRCRRRGCRRGCRSGRWRGCRDRGHRRRGRDGHRRRRRPRTRRRGRRRGPGARRSRGRGRAAPAVLLAAVTLLGVGPEATHVAVEGLPGRDRRRRRRRQGDHRLGLLLRAARDHPVAGHQQVDQRRQQQAGQHADAALAELPAIVGHGHLLLEAAGAMADVVVARRGGVGAPAIPDVRPLRVRHYALRLAARCLRAAAGASTIARRGARAARVARRRIGGGTTHADAGTAHANAGAAHAGAGTAPAGTSVGDAGAGNAARSVG
mmetsp:Transcript_60303/g.171413  ORF Transcript_60303/g.171413 Transcript_60303/m.171413 type:complete len:312 (+) Transcript_60303:393-1328(+)